MAAKQLLPSQCDFLHEKYGASNCCLCKAFGEMAKMKSEHENLLVLSREACSAYFSGEETPEGYRRCVEAMLKLEDALKKEDGDAENRR